MDSIEHATPTARRRHRAHIVGACLTLVVALAITSTVVADGSPARPGISPGYASPGTPAPTDRQLASTCISWLKTNFPQVRNAGASLRLLYEAYIDVPNYGGYEIVVVYVNGPQRYWDCMGSGTGALNFKGQTAEPRGAEGSTAGAFSVYYPLYLGSTCRTRTWMVYANTSPAVSTVVAVVNGVTVTTHPTFGLASVLLREHSTSDVIGREPFGELLGFDASGHLIAHAQLLPGSYWSEKEPRGCPH